MLGVIRRGSSCSLGVLRSVARPSSLNLATPHRSSKPSQSFLSPARTARQYHVVSRLQSSALGTAVAEEDTPISSNEAGQKFMTKFEELATNGLVSKNIINVLSRDMKIETMTPVQAQTINEALNGQDIIAQARTGTGKTLAFLIPLLQNILSKSPELEHPNARRDSNAADIRAIIISPTRELAEQIAVEAKKVVKGTGVVVQTAVGGTAKSFGLQQIRRLGCHILVGTPGRLNDILSDPSSGVRAPNLSAFVLDEADRLLDSGFSQEIQNIERLLPDKRTVDRQTLMFSATIPDDVIDMVNSFMKPHYKFVQTIQKGEQQTHERVVQKSVVISGFENTMPALLELTMREQAARKHSDMPFKAIVFFNANAEAILASATFRNLREPGGLPSQHPLHPTQIVEMHSRLSQGQRTRNADTFRRSKSAIMFSSDVTARGMDFPNVTHVIQAGLPSSSEIYIHRLGRTARGDKSGEGWILLTPFEDREARSRLGKLQIKRDDSLGCAKIDMSQDAQLPAPVADVLTRAAQAASTVPLALKSAAYKATLGVFSWFGNKQALIDAMNKRSMYGWGMREPPMIGPSLASKLGLRRIAGVNIGREEESSPRGSSSSSYGGARSRSSSGGDRYAADRGYNNPRGRFGDRDSVRPRSSGPRYEGGRAGPRVRRSEDYM